MLSLAKNLKECSDRINETLVELEEKLAQGIAGDNSASELKFTTPVLAEEIVEQEDVEKIVTPLGAVIVLSECDRGNYFPSDIRSIEVRGKDVFIELSDRQENILAITYANLYRRHFGLPELDYGHWRSREIQQLLEQRKYEPIGTVEERLKALGGTRGYGTVRSAQEANRRRNKNWK